jgi:tRNA pseudouridine38-40 synthase
MRVLKLTLAYDGTRFVGWQRQAEGESIQGLLEEALARFEGAPVTVHGAGRTDAGVHALGQVASARVTFTHDATDVARALNAQLPEDIRVIDVADVRPDFHARFSARSKTYTYQMRTDAVSSPFDRAYAWHVPEPLDVDGMRQAARALIGTHDFAAFQSTGTVTSRTVRTISRSEMNDVERALLGAPKLRSSEGGSGSPRDLLTYEITGDGFLRHMVRAIVGTLVEIGRGRRPATGMADLVAGGTRADAGATAPAHGLFLVRVDYDEVRDVP